MNLKKALIAILACSLAAFTVFSATACAPNPENLIRDAITKEFDTYKNMDDSALQEIASSAEKQGLSELGIDNMEFANIVLDGFDYNIDSIKVDGDHATVDMTIVSKSSSDFERKLSAAMETLQTSPEIATMDDNQKLEKIGQIVMDSFQDIAIVTENVTIDYTLMDGTWTPTNSASALGALDSVVFAQSI